MFRLKIFLKIQNVSRFRRGFLKRLLKSSFGRDMSILSFLSSPKLVVVITPPLPRDGGAARTVI